MKIHRRFFLFLKLFRESYIFAIQNILVNKMRTILSLLGITIGIFSIIAVFTITDSMENRIRESIESLGSNVVFIQKWPWSFENNYPWWKYINRPVPNLQEMNEIQKRSNTADNIVFMLSMEKSIKYAASTIENIDVIAVTHDYDKVFNLDIEKGRYFSAFESSGGKNVVIIGSDVANKLFGVKNPIDEQIKVLGRKVTVIGVVKKEGEGAFGTSPDNQIFLPVNYIKNIVDINNEFYNPFIAVKAKKNVDNDEMKDELTGVMRSLRRLKPVAEDNFALNETSLMSEGFKSIFGVVTLAGWIIGGFSILVGGFGIANIMFVSVKERTNIIGIQKSLGAKNYFILLQFLFEAVFLCLLGGSLGLLLIYLGTLFIQYLSGMDLVLTQANIFLGLFVSLLIGLVSGLFPAFNASRLDPVEAIRSNG